MPIAAVAPTETTVTPATGSVQMLLSSPGTANRFWVEVVNSNATHKLYVATSAAACTTAAKCADPSNGVAEFPIGPNVPLYCLWESGATASPVRIVQYCTA